MPAPEELESNSYNLKTFQVILNVTVHIFIGIVVGIAVVFACQLPSGATQLHIFICTIGYQLLMSQAILSLSPTTSWTSHLKLVDKRRVHWILQIMGSSLAIAGSIVKIVDKSTHFNSLHGIFGIIALVFTILSLVNGLTSLYAYELRRFLPGNISKITHVCFGVIAYAAACITLCLGFNKNFFINWATQPVTNMAIVFTSIFTVVVIINPSITFYNKAVRVVK